MLCVRPRSAVTLSPFEFTDFVQRFCHPFLPRSARFLCTAPPASGLAILFSSYICGTSLTVSGSRTSLPPVPRVMGCLGNFRRLPGDKATPLTTVLS